MNILTDRLNNQASLDLLKKEFNNASPYRHIVLDNFLKEDFSNKLHLEFPPVKALSKHYKGLNENKSEGADFKSFDSSFGFLRSTLNSNYFQTKLSYITGIKNLFSPEDALGCGLHQGSNGSYLDIHNIDFNIHHVKKIHRRLNLLIYLNKNWQEEYGGKLELWNSNVTKMEQAYLPVFNRCVIFETNDISYHGYSKITVPENITRKSVYAYYYTKLGDYQEEYHDTRFKARPEEGLIKKVKTNFKETFKNNVKRTLLKIGVKF